MRRDVGCAQKSAGDDDAARNRLPRRGNVLETRRWGTHCQPEHQLYSQPGMRNASLEALTMSRMR
jgi:hypothetical protein